MKKTLSAFSLTALILFVVLLPSLLFSSGLASSLAMGTLISSVALVGLALVRGWSPKRIFESMALTSALILIILIHLGTVSILFGIDFSRATLSAIIFAVMAIGSKAFADFFLQISWEDMVKVSRSVLYFLLGLGLLGALDFLQPFADVYNKPVFPFSEPSFFALVLVPFLILACVLVKARERFIYIVATMALALFLQNLTLVIGCILAALASFGLRFSLFFILPGIFITIFQAGADYYIERISIFGETTNLSALVFLQGWQLAWRSVIDTYGVGRGFQQLGVIEVDVPASELINSIIGNNLNLSDGGFNFAKIVGEFGAIGLIAALLYLVSVVRAFFILRKAAARGCGSAIMFAASLVFGYLLELFIRGAGYFTPTGMMLLAAFWMWRSGRQQKSINYFGSESSGKKCYT